MQFEDTILKDRPMLKEAYESSLGHFQSIVESVLSRVTSDEVRQQVLANVGGSAEAFHRNTFLDLTVCLAESDVVSDEAIAATFYYGQAKKESVLCTLS